jgi:ADP-ribose pyrophosphatase YjhB (NUDIX family)
MEKWKQRLGVYGIYVDNKKLLVVKKTRGPYVNRFDLPGGSFDSNESIIQCLKRELKEEVGCIFSPKKMIGIFDYLIPWKIKDYTHLHHLAIYYEIDLPNKLKQRSIVADDTAGYELIDINNLNELNSSPLIMEAVNYIKGKEQQNNIKRYDDWKVIGELVSHGV